MSTLYVVATPIGNLEDLSPRALRILGDVDALACEDTRVTRKIFQRFGIAPPPALFSCHEHNEGHVCPRVLSLLAEGKRVALCSDGGCPTISDPGYRLVNAALDAGFRVEPIPGPCAIETALMASGMPTSSFTFLGFPPPKGGKRRNWLAREAEAVHTLVCYESPRRVGALLGDAATVLGERKAAVCIELTKMHERVVRGYLPELAAVFSGEAVKGEVVVVMAGNNPKFCRIPPAG